MRDRMSSTACATRGCAGSILGRIVGGGGRLGEAHAARTVGCGAVVCVQRANVRADVAALCADQRVRRDLPDQLEHLVVVATIVGV